MDSHCERTWSPDLAGLAGLLADGTRASFCLALLDGRAWTAAELARHAGVAAPTATGHLNLLVAGGPASTGANAGRTWRAPRAPRSAAMP